MVQISAQQGRSSVGRGQKLRLHALGPSGLEANEERWNARGDSKLACKPRAARLGQSFSRVQQMYALIPSRLPQGCQTVSKYGACVTTIFRQPSFVLSESFISVKQKAFTVCICKD